MIQKAAIAGIPSALTQSGIESSALITDTLAIREQTGWTIARLHALPGSDAPRIAGDELPQNVGECRDSGPIVLCLRPREWLFMSDSKEFSQSSMMRRVEHEDAAWSDLTDGLTVFRLEGAGAPWLLNKLSCLDYQSSYSADEHCARTRIGRVAVVVRFHRTKDQAAVFDLIVDRSLARYLWELLCASAPHANDLVKAHGEAA